MSCYRRLGCQRFLAAPLPARAPGSLRRSLRLRLRLLPFAPLRQRPPYHCCRCPPVMHRLEGAGGAERDAGLLLGLQPEQQLLRRRRGCCAAEAVRSHERFRRRVRRCHQVGPLRGSGKVDCDGLAGWLLGETTELDKLLSLSSWVGTNPPRILDIGGDDNVMFLQTSSGVFMVHLESMQFSVPQGMGTSDGHDGAEFFHDMRMICSVGNSSVLYWLYRWW